MCRVAVISGGLESRDGVSSLFDVYVMLVQCSYLCDTELGFIIMKGGAFSLGQITLLSVCRKSCFSICSNRSQLIFRSLLLLFFKFVLTAVVLQSFLGFGQSADIEIQLDDADNWRTAEIKTEDGRKERCYLFYDGESISGKVFLTHAHSVYVSYVSFIFAPIFIFYMCSS